VRIVQLFLFSVAVCFIEHFQTAKAQEPRSALKQVGSGKSSPESSGASRRDNGPAEIPIRLPEGKPGFRRIRELSGEGYTYSYDQSVSKPEKIRLFQIRRDRSDQDSHSLRINWMTASDLEDGQLYSLAGQVYRWNGKDSKMLRIPDDPNTIEVQEEGDERVAVFRDLHLGVPGDESHLFQIWLLQFDAAGPKKNDRIKVHLLVDGQQELKLPDDSKGGQQCKVWLSSGDEVEAPYFRVKLHRIVRPDPEKKNPGWAEFSVSPGAAVKN
jgi:hypothetical protein